MIMKKSTGMQNLRRGFASWDHDGSGYLTHEEFKRGLDSLGFAVDEETVKVRIFARNNRRPFNSLSISESLSYPPLTRMNSLHFYHARSSSRRWISTEEATSTIIPLSTLSWKTWMCLPVTSTPSHTTVAQDLYHQVLPLRVTTIQAIEVILSTRTSSRGSLG
jgi:hypothetical protein